MRYCTRCLYPENAKPTIIFDDEGVCSGCRYHESRKTLDIPWDERWAMLEELAADMKRQAKARGNAHDCIIPVSGGKDSHYQVWLLQQKLGLNPLLVTFNHGFNTQAGCANLDNLVRKSGCDLIRYTAGPNSVRRIARYMLEKVGDITWHYHAGIRTFPFQVACKYNIPYIMFGEHGFAELTGIVSLEDFVEHTRWTRKEHDMRGLEAEDLIGHNGITRADIEPYVYPTDEQLEKCEVRGLYLSNFIHWDAKAHGEFMMKTWGFSGISYERDRSFNLYGKIEDHANEVHDFMKYLKFGYGRATDDASMEIRHGRMTREEGIAMVKRYDAREPKVLDFYCGFLGITKQDFYDLVEPMRDEKIWQKVSGVWTPLDSVDRHPIGPAEEKQRVEQVATRTLGEDNRHLYYNPANPPLPTGNRNFDEATFEPRWV